MKFVLGIIFSVVAILAQPTVSPSTINVTFDIAKDTIINLPDVTISSGSSVFAYNTVLQNTQNAVLVWPVQGFIPQGTNAVIRMSIVRSDLTVGNYTIPVTFVQNSPSVSVSVGVNLTVIDSRTFVASSNPTIPHIAAGSGWKTTVTLVNTSNSVSLVTLKFYDTSGQNTSFAINNGFSVNEYSVAVPGNSLMNVVMDNLTGIKTGSIDIRTVYGTGVVAQATYSNSLFEATIPSSIPNRDSFVLPYDNIGVSSTGVALVNYLNWGQDVSLTFFDDLGQLYNTSKVFVPANGQVSFTLDTSFEQTKGKSGILRVTTQRPGLTGFGLKFNKDKNYFTTIPIY